MGIVVPYLGQNLITWGYGPIAVIIPPEVIGKPPRVIYIEKEYFIELEKLALVKPWHVRIDLSSLSIAKLDEFLIALSDFKVALPAEVQKFLEKLSLAKIGMFEVSLDELTRFVKEGKAVIYLDAESIKTMLRKYVKARKLLDLIDEL